MMTDSRNQQLQHKIKSLSAFKTHFSVFAVAIGSLWLVWYFMGQRTIYAWPLYPTIIWGSILLFHFLFVYREFLNRKKKNED
jgi:cell division protein FtsW (lipid II flippase)